MRKVILLTVICVGLSTFLSAQSRSEFQIGVSHHQAILPMMKKTSFLPMAQALQVQVFMLAINF